MAEKFERGFTAYVIGCTIATTYGIIRGAEWLITKAIKIQKAEDEKERLEKEKKQDNTTE